MQTPYVHMQPNWIIGSRMSRIPITMKHLHRPTLVILGAVFSALLFFTGCNTARGVGRDVERAGEEIQDATN